MQFSIIIPTTEVNKQLIDSLQRNQISSIAEIIIISNSNIFPKHKSKLDSLGVSYYQQLELRSPYRSKNIGYLNSKGNILVYIDSTILLCNSSLKSIIASVEEIKCFEVLTCNYSFEYKNNPPALFELYDTLTLQSDDFTNGLPGGFLVVKRSIMDDVGLFLDVRSLADIEWTRRAIKKGYSIDLIPNHTLNYLPKDKTTLLSKAKRMGAGRSKLYYKHNNPLNERFFLIYAIKQLLPTNPLFFYRLFQRKSKPEHQGKFINLYWVSYLIKLYYFLGILKR